MFRKSCLLCGSKKIQKVMDFGMHPYADTFIDASRLSESEPVYPLTCDLCAECGQIQTACVTNPKDRYSQYEYSYTSSNSAFSRGHWEEYAKSVCEKLQIKEDSLVVEIGSNDGFLAEQFKKNGFRIIGVDPSAYMATLARKRGIRTITQLFDKKVASEIMLKEGKAQLIVANNVFNHADNPAEFAKAVVKLLARGGTFVFESPYWLHGFQTKKFDQIYHEHISYFSVKSIANLMKKVGLTISHIEMVNYHGGSLRVYARKRKDTKETSSNVRAMIAQENKAGLFDTKAYERFMNDITRQRSLFLKSVYEIKSHGDAIIAVGAAAKGNTLLNYYNLDSSVIDYVTDSSLHKQGKYTPLTRIPICGDEIFSQYKKVYALILSWNISDSLKKSLSKINSTINYLSLK